MNFEPLTEAECDDLFRQMQKTLDANNGVVPDKHLLACELENFFRLRQTVYQLRATVRAGDTAIRTLEHAVSVLEAESGADCWLRSQAAGRRDDVQIDN